MRFTFQWDERLKKYNFVFYMKRQTFAIPILLVLVVCGQCYAIEGSWQSISYPGVLLKVSELNTDTKSVNQYEVAISTCGFLYTFKIYESFLSLTNLNQLPGNTSCKSSDAEKVFKSLQQKVFYFEIDVNQLIIITVFGTNTYHFVRAPSDQTNSYLQGQFKDLKNGYPVLMSNQTVFLCDGKLRANYTTDYVSTFKLIVSSVLNNNCTSQQGDNQLQVLSRATNYRMENPNVLTFYDKYQMILRLQFYRNFDSSLITPPKEVNSQVSNQTQVNEHDGGANSTTSSTVQKNETIAIEKPVENQTHVPIVEQNKTVNVSDKVPSTEPKSNSGSLNQTSTPSELQNKVDNASGTTSAPAQTHNQTKSQTTLTAQNQNKSSVISQNQASPSTPIKPVTSLPTVPVQPSIPDVSSQVKNNGQLPNKTVTKSVQRPIELQLSNALGTYDTEYFHSGSNWPSKIRFNGTNIVFQGCNIVSIPVRITFPTQTIQTSVKDATTLTRKACGIYDDIYTELIGNSTSIEAAANDTHILMSFFDKNHEKTFQMSRPLTAGEKDKIVFKKVAQPQAQPAITNNQTSGATGQANSANSNVAQSTPNGIVTVPSTEAPSATRLLVGIYNPTKIYTMTLPPPLSDPIKFLFTLTSVAITGTCMTYKYPLSVTQETNGNVSIIIDQSNRISQASKSGCDQTQDNLFLNPLIASTNLSMISSNGVTKAVLSDISGRTTLQLVKKLVV